MMLLDPLGPVIFHIAVILPPVLYLQLYRHSAGLRLPFFRTHTSSTWGLTIPTHISPLTFPLLWWPGLMIILGQPPSPHTLDSSLTPLTPLTQAPLSSSTAPSSPEPPPQLPLMPPCPLQLLACSQLASWRSVYVPWRLGLHSCTGYCISDGNV